MAVECRGGCVLARDRRPVLVVGTVETRPSRRRRTPEDTCPPSQCCLHRLYIDFARIGWTFVKEPPGYEINYCHGPCNCESLRVAALPREMSLIGANCRSAALH